MQIVVLVWSRVNPVYEEDDQDEGMFCSGHNDKPAHVTAYIYVCMLSECRTLWGEHDRAPQWFGNVAEFEQGQYRCCQHHMTGKQRVATAVFSQHHHEKMVLHRCVLF